MRSEDSRLARVVWYIGDEAIMGCRLLARISCRIGTRSTPPSLAADSLL